MPPRRSSVVALALSLAMLCLAETDQIFGPISETGLKALESRQLGDYAVLTKKRAPSDLPAASTTTGR
jgi:hypothetical protein